MRVRRGSSEVLRRLLSTSRCAKLYVTSMPEKNTLALVINKTVNWNVLDDEICEFPQWQLHSVGVDYKSMQNAHRKLCSEGY